MQWLRKFLVMTTITALTGLSASTLLGSGQLTSQFSGDRAPGSEPYDPAPTLYDNFQANFTTGLASQDSAGQFNVRSADDFKIAADSCPGGEFEITRIRAQVIQTLSRTQPFGLEILADNGFGTAPTPDNALVPLYVYPETSRTDLGHIGFDTHLYELGFDTPGMLIPGNIVHWISVFGLSAEANAEDFYNFFGASDGAAGTTPNAVLLSPDFDVFVWTPVEIVINGSPLAFSFAIDGDCTNTETRANFTVTKDFTDDNKGGPENPTEVDVTLDCFTGLPIMQTQTISQNRDVEFIVKDFENLELDCIITEDTNASELYGYTPTYIAGGPNSSSTTSSCKFDSLASGSDYTCHIENDATPVNVNIEKLWVIDGDGGDFVDTNYSLTLFCDAEIENGAKHCHSGFGGGPVSFNSNYESCYVFEGSTSRTFLARVTPEWPETHCWVDERVYDSSVDVDNDCDNLTISHGQGDNCRVTNSVFFEGIPSLSQYGMAILALLMLGVGMLGFRRFS